MQDPEERIKHILEVNQARVDQLGNIRSELLELKMDLIIKKDVDIVERLNSIILSTKL